ncbi:protein FRIGIDA-like isoform X2 [Telopea speciosissima]|uniref:protein FRIGIDA-like isoform X2 n=1 Tax=Telopea speciosissima TaxID=54955 RepID=UPI001CC4AD84|nr:protein FRIGIDA-like isoform X2 [Telopea speciosissima]
MAATSSDSAAVGKQEDGEPMSTLVARFVQEERKELPLLKEVDELRGLSSALSTFRCRWDELQKHIAFIQNAIEGKIKRSSSTEHVTPLQLPSPLPPEVVPAVDAPASGSANLPLPDSVELSSRDFTQVSSPSDETAKNLSRSELEWLCETMGSRGLRKYMASHLSDTAKLREEAPVALKRAPNPAKLVLDCIGRFYLQGSKAYTKDSPMVPTRQASVLMLEFFLLADCFENGIDPLVKEEAEVAAVAWRKRLISEGGVSKAHSMDARGLLLFISCYGIPSVFGYQDLSDLIRLSSPREIADALRRSCFLLERVLDIIQGMEKNRMHIEAIDVACTFWVEEEKFPQKILASFLRESKEIWKRMRREAQGSPAPLKEANERQLAALKSLIKCLEDHKMDPTKILSGWHISDKITNLEKEIADLENKIEEKANLKRKAGEIESSRRMRTHEVKRPWPSTNILPQELPAILVSQEQRTVGLPVGSSSNDGLSNKNIFTSGFPSLLRGYLGVSSVARAAVQDTKGNVHGTIAGIGSGLATVAANGSGVAGSSTRSGGVWSTGPFFGIGGALLGGDGVGQITANVVGPSGWYGDEAFKNGSVQNSFHDPASSGKGFFGLQPSLEQGFLGLPTTQTPTVMKQSSGSNLYRFADTILEGDTYYQGGSYTGEARTCKSNASGY